MTQPDIDAIAQAHHSRGLALSANGDFAGALECFAQILALKPGDADAAVNHGNMLQKLGHIDEAIVAYQRVIGVQPDHALAHFNLGRAYAANGRPEAALVAYDSTLALQPDYAAAQWAKGMTLLTLGDFPAGWALYEARWHAPSFGHTPRHFPRPVWDGSALTGKTILIHAEQGFGDTIQFCRYVPLLVSQSARVLLLAQPELKTLLSASLPCPVFAPGDKIPNFDVHAALLSLPHLMGATLETVPAVTPYLKPPPENVARWTTLLPTKTKMRIGLAWSGRRTHIDDQQRSLTLEALKPVWTLDAEFHALQIDINDADQATLASSPLQAFHLEPRDFGDAAAHIAAMDLVITVDTSLAHLAGALNKPVWILLAYKPDFRWLLNRSDSPWYPTAKLFRQTQRNAWPEVIARVATELRALL